MHNTEKISIKTAKIDKKIKNLVLWFNAFSSVTTLWSCQGLNKEEQEEVNSRMKDYFPGEIVPNHNGVDTSFYAYVVFVCNDQEQLSWIIDCIQEFACYKRDHKDIGFIRVDVNYDRTNKRLEYSLYMEKEEYPDMLVEYWDSVYKPRMVSGMRLVP